MSFRTALAADFKREYKNVDFLWKQRPRIGGADTGEIFMLLGNEGDREAACGPRKPGLVFDEAEGLPCGNGREGALASSARSKQRKTASSRIVRACTRDIL